MLRHHYATRGVRELPEARVLPARYSRSVGIAAASCFMVHALRPSPAVVRACNGGVMKLAAVLDLLIGAGLAWFTYELRGELDSPDAWLAVGIGLLAALMLASGVALAARAAWGPRLGRSSGLGGLLIGGAALAVGAILLIGGDRQDAGSGAAKAALGLVLLLVFAVAFQVNRTISTHAASPG
jgi:hypothetical protein